MAIPEDFSRQCTQSSRRTKFNVLVRMNICEAQLRRVNKTNDAGITIYFHDLPIFELSSYILNAAHTWFAVFTRDERPVLQFAANFQDYGGRGDEEWCPSRVGGHGDQNIARKDLFLEGVVQHFDGTADFYDVSLNIAGGMGDIRFVNENAGVDLDTVWMDGNYSGVETGSYDRPFSVLSDAIDKAKSGGTVMLKSGSTTISTPQTLSKNIRIEAE